MLTARDIAFMKRTRDEVVANRRRPLVLHVATESVRNPITGVVEEGGVEEVEVMSVVNDRTSRVAAERRIQDQAEVVEGDIWFSISLDQLVGINTESIKYAIHNGVKYAVVAQDPKGIGEYNRYEFVGKRVK